MKRKQSDIENKYDASDKSDDNNQHKLDITTLACSVCRSKFAKYRCPACNKRTCSLNCVNIHKTEANCVGYDPSRFVALPEWTEGQLYRDYQFLEEVYHSLLFARKNTEIPNITDRKRYFKKMLTEAVEKKCNLLFMPPGMQRAIYNKTYFDKKNNVIYWTIEWVFKVKKNEIHIYQDKVDERIEISNIISTLISPSIESKGMILYDNNHDKISQNEVSLVVAPLYRHIDNLHAYIMTIPSKRKSFHELNLYLSLSKSILGLNIIEFPTIFIHGDN